MTLNRRSLLVRSSLALAGLPFRGFAEPLARLSMQGEPDFPAIPDLVNLNGRPPAQSDVVVLETSKKRLTMYANSDNSGKYATVFDVPLMPNENSNYGWLVNYWDGKPPADYVLTLREFWRPVLSDYTRVNPGSPKEVSVTKSWGLSNTDSESVTASLGYKGVVSASISATFSHSVTTSSSDSTTEKLTIGAPADGNVRVWLLWQLVHEMVALMPNGQVLPLGNTPGAIRKADVHWTQFMKPSGAWVNYTKTAFQFPSTVFVPYQRDFPIKGATA